MPSFWYDDPAAHVPRIDPVPERADVVVVGAGITGLTTALLLSRAGKHVVVLEARSVGAGTTGHTTGKLSLLQGTKLSQMLRHQSEHVARAYVEGNLEGRDWLARLCEDHGRPLEVRDAVTFALKPQERSTVEEEHRACQRLGLPTTFVDDPDLGVPNHGAVVLKDQYQLDPAPVLDLLLDEFSRHGGLLREGSRVISVSALGGPTVKTDDGVTISCDDVIIATGTPTLDRGLYFAKVEPQRSYVLMYRGTETPGSMLLSAGSPSFSVRDVTGPAGERLLMVGGNGHVVGRAASEHGHLDGLRAWAEEHFPGGTETHAWSAQDYSSHDGLPYIGRLPRGLGHIYVATGYDKWGLTNGTAAGLRLAGELLGEAPSWATPISRRITRPRGAMSIVSTNLKVGLALAKGITLAELQSVDDTPAEGQGSVGRAGVNPLPVGTSTVDGTTCSVVGICTHLGGVLEWNDAERTWDCPLHGSRFSPEGEVIEGPATKPLKRVGRKVPTG